MENLAERGQEIMCVRTLPIFFVIVIVPDINNFCLKFYFCIAQFIVLNGGILSVFIIFV